MEGFWCSLGVSLWCRHADVGVAWVFIVSWFLLCLLCQEWARHTGRFREGIDEPDYVKWKTRLRCAFNKAPDIEEVKEESQLEGPDPFRVYILKPRKSNCNPFSNGLCHRHVESNNCDQCLYNVFIWGATL